MFTTLPRNKKISTLFVLLSLLSLPIAGAQEPDLPSWLLRALKKDDPETLGYQVVVNVVRGVCQPTYSTEDEIKGRIDGILQGAFQLARLKALPIVSSELHLKVEFFCFAHNPYARVAFAFLKSDGTHLSIDYDFFPKNYRSDLYTSVELAVDSALRTYIRVNFAADM